MYEQLGGIDSWFSGLFSDNPMTGMQVKDYAGKAIGTVSSSGEVISFDGAKLGKVDDYGNAVTSDGTAIGAVGWDGQVKAATASAKKNITAVAKVASAPAVYQPAPQKSVNYMNWIIGGGVVFMSAAAGFLLWNMKNKKHGGSHVRR